MSYDSAAMNANPNNTQLPAHHNDLPTHNNDVAAQPGTHQAFAPKETRSGEADYPYIDGGERPQPASLNPRHGVPASLNTTEGHTGPLDASSGANTYGAAGTGNASAFKDPAGASEYHHKSSGLGSDNQPMHRLHSQNDPLPPPKDQHDRFDATAVLNNRSPTHRIQSKNEVLPVASDLQKDRSNDLTSHKRPNEHPVTAEDRPLGVKPVPQVEGQHDRSHDRTHDRAHDLPHDRPHDRLNERQRDRPNDRSNDRPNEHSAYTEDRPLGVKPAPEGGVAVHGRENLPEGHATVTDKIIGKTQKVVGKMTHNMDMHERGELREAGGKSAALGDARAPHD